MKRRDGRRVILLYGWLFRVGSTGGHDILVTPFAQLLNSLRTVRTNVMLLAEIPPSR